MTEENDAEMQKLIDSGTKPAQLSGDLRGSGRTLIISGLVYCGTSASLILLNKYALASFHFTAPNTLLLFHCSLAVALVKGCEVVGFIQVEPLRWEIVKRWLPVNVLFVGMIVTGFYALALIGVGMFTMLKNLANLFTILGDYYFFGKTYSYGVWGCLGLMLLSAIAGGCTDLRFSMLGYTWQIVNCAITAGYALYLSGVMDKVAPFTHNKQRLSEFSMVYYNNFLSLFFLIFLVFAFGEETKILKMAAVYNPKFQFVAIVGGLLGFCISFASLWFVSRSTATIYSLVGSMNKIIVAVVGMLVFKETTNINNIASVVLGLAAGVLFGVVKAREMKR